VLAFAYLVIVGSLVAFTAYVWLLQNAPISQVATYAYVNPVVAIALGALFVNEEVTPIVAGAAAVIVASVAGTVKQEARKREAAPVRA
jgi:drug/metabolite transporter (DMT)-like permease